MAVNLRALIGKLNHTTRSAVEAAAGLCLSRTHYDVEVEHYLMKLLDNTDNARTPAMSPHIACMLDEAWSIGSLDYGANQVRTGHTIIALLADEELARLVKDVSRELTKIPVETLRKDLTALTADSTEEAQASYAAAGGGAPASAGDGARPAGGGKT